MDKNEYIQYLNYVAALWPWIIAIVGGLLFFWRGFINFVRSIVFLYTIYSYVTINKIDILKELANIAITKNEFEIRHRITESKIKLALYICDVSGCCIYVNDYLCELWGMDYKELLGSGWLAAIIEKDRIDTRDLWVESVEKRVPYSAEYSIINQRTKQIIKIKTRAHCVKSMDGKECVCYIGSAEVNE